MPLDTNALTEAFKSAFNDAKDKEWTSDQVAEALAAAIDSFVRSGAVTGITVSVPDIAGNLLTGTQTGSGTID